VPSPAFSDGTLYFGVGPAFYALDAQTGQELWKIQSKTWFYGAALANHVVYVGNDDGYFYAFNSKTGEEIWKSPLAGAGWSSPAIANGRVYVGNRDQHLYVFDAQTGSELWKTELEDWATSDPLVSDDVIYVGSGNHENHEGPRQLYALDARTGAELWKFRADSRLLTAPALSANTMYVLSISGTVYALKAPTPTSTFSIGSVEVSEKDDMKLLYVPAGEFAMGSENGEDNEKPAHTVFLDSFWVDQTEVTNSMYALCVNDGKCNVPGSKESLTRKNYYGDAQYNNYPVIFVDWNMAKTYCEWAGRRLPTEAEWEKVARGTEAFVYPWGNAMPDKNLLNYKDVNGDTTEVGIYPKGASPYGALDMAGNVWEWVNDWFASDYYQNSPASNPLGPESGSTHVLRGGSWNLNDDLVRSTYRGTHPSEPNLGIGFRCAMDAKHKRSSNEIISSSRSNKHAKNIISVYILLILSACAAPGAGSNDCPQRSVTPTAVATSTPQVTATPLHFLQYMVISLSFLKVNREHGMTASQIRVRSFITMACSTCSATGFVVFRLSHKLGTSLRPMAIHGQNNLTNLFSKPAMSLMPKAMYASSVITE
jgi:formylglycine-generating enzyme required for sulfatase activity